MDIQSIGFVELLGGIGDLVMALPALRALAWSHPNARVSVLTFRPGGELLDGEPWIDEVIFAERAGADDPSPAEPRASVERYLRDRAFDLVVTNTCYGGIDRAVEQSDAPVRVTRLWRGAREDEPIETLFLRNLVELGLIRPDLADTTVSLTLSAAERAWAAAWWRRRRRDPRSTVLLNPGAGMPIKAWPSDRLVEVGRHLASAGWSIGVLAATGPASPFAVGGEIPGAFVVPLLPIRRFAAVCADVALFVAADTGPARIAAAMGVPVVSVFGPTVAGRYGLRGNAVNLMSPFPCPERRPLDFTQQPCWYSGRCSFPEKQSCCEDVSTEAVIEAVDRLLVDGGERQSSADREVRSSG